MAESNETPDAESSDGPQSRAEAIEFLREQFPDDIPKWERLVDALKSAVSEIWPESDEDSSQLPNLLMGGQFGDLPIPIHISTMGVCQTLGFGEDMVEILTMAHQKHHGVDPETGLSPMSDLLTFDEAKEQGIIPEEMVAEIEGFIAGGMPEEAVRIVKHVDTNDLEELEVGEEHDYDISWHDSTPEEEK